MKTKQDSSELLMRNGLLFLCLLSTSNVVLATSTTPTDEFIIDDSEIVTHKTTKLMWKRCAEGQIWDGHTCTGDHAAYTYDEAVILTSTAGGYTDWRLPTLTELRSIVAREKHNPTINTLIFPNCPATWFWSASITADYDYGAWNVSFYNGDRHYNLKSQRFAVRLVRSLP